MPGFEVEDHITASLKRLAIMVPEAAAQAAVKAALAGAQTLRRKVPKARKVFTGDLVPGFAQPSEWISISAVPEGAQLDFKSFYGNLRDDTLRMAMTGAGQAHRFPRERLDIHLKGANKLPGPAATVDFSQAPRLEQWAKDHYQDQRRSILVDGAAQIAPYLQQVEAQARLSIYQDLSKITVPVVAPVKIT